MESCIFSTEILINGVDSVDEFDFHTNISSNIWNLSYITDFFNNDLSTFYDLLQYPSRLKIQSIIQKSQNDFWLSVINLGLDKIQSLLIKIKSWISQNDSVKLEIDFSTQRRLFPEIILMNDKKYLRNTLNNKESYAISLDYLSFSHGEFYVYHNKFYGYFLYNSKNCSGINGRNLQCGRIKGPKGTCGLPHKIHLPICFI